MASQYREVRIRVVDNGYNLAFENYLGPSPLEQGYSVAKTLDEVKEVLQTKLLAKRED